MLESEFNVGLDSALRQQIGQLYIQEGRLFGSLPTPQLTRDEINALLRAGWIERPYQDRPVMEPPSTTVDWDGLRQLRHEATLRRIAAKDFKDWPWAGDRRAILEEVLDSAWEEKSDEIRIWLNAWTFASLWYGPPRLEEAEGAVPIEQRQEFFFYTERMLQIALQAIDESIAAADESEDFWYLVGALTDG